MSPQAAASSLPKAEGAATDGGSTREQLVEAAADLFAAQGYGSISVRDLGRRAGVTSGAIYGQFRGKADLLAEAVDSRLTRDLWTLPDDVTSRPLHDIVAYQFEHYKSREQLMFLLIEGALAARGEPEVRQRLSETVGRRIDTSSASFVTARASEGFAPDVDLDAAVKIVWSVEIGLRVLAALGIDLPDEPACADIMRRFLTGLQGPTEQAAGHAPSQKQKTSKTGSAKPNPQGHKVKKTKKG